MGEHSTSLKRAFSFIYERKYAKLGASNRKEVNIMKKFLIGTVVVIFGLIIISSIGKMAGNPAVKDAFNKGQEDAKKALETPKPVKHAVLLSDLKDTGEPVVDNIILFENAGSGGVENAPMGTVPHNTKVEVIESRVADGITFYHIRSSVGKVDVLPTNLQLRQKAMETKPKSEWYVDADPTFPVEGWVTDDFVKNVE